MQAYYGRGITFRLQGKLKEALSDLDKVIELAPDDAAAHYHRGQVLRQMGRTQEALQAFRTVLHSILTTRV